MGSKKKWSLFTLFYSISLSWSLLVAAEEYSPVSLNSFLYNYSFNNTPRIVSGKLYDVSLPQNLSGMEVSVVRLRTRSLWLNGVNFSSMEIPKRILPRPFRRRVDIVYQNLGNWSSLYYNVPGYAFVGPVVGFVVYDSSDNLTSYGRNEVDLVGGNPIVVRFTGVGDGNGNVGVKCVKFGRNGTVELGEVIGGRSCLGRGSGHFSIVVPSRGGGVHEGKRGVNNNKWLVVGIVAGVVGLLLVVVAGVFGYKFFDARRMRTLERESERSEVLDTVWVGTSKMPKASGIRTQPVLETTYYP